MRSSEIKALMRKRYCAPEWALAFEVSDATGGGLERRHADAVAMNLWPSRGLGVHGFEIKISKSDWLRELQNPRKAEAVSKYCDFWWIVAPEGVVNETAIPDTWGLIVVKKGKLFTAKQAPQRTPEPITKDFMASLFRRTSAVDDDDVEAIVRLRVAAADAQREKDFETRVQARLYKYEGLERSIDEFEKNSGINIREFSHRSDDLGKAVQLVMDCGVFGSYRTVEGLCKTMAETAANIDAALGKYGASKIHPMQLELEKNG